MSAALLRSIMAARSAALALLLSLFACATTPANPPAARPARDAMSVRWLLDWNEVLAQKLGRACASHPWRADFERRRGRKPVVKVEVMRNFTSHPIDGRIVSHLIGRELLAAGVEVTAGEGADVVLEGRIDAQYDGDFTLFVVSAHLVTGRERRIWSDVAKLLLTADGDRAPVPGALVCRVPR